MFMVQYWAVHTRIGSVKDPTCLSKHTVRLQAPLVLAYKAWWKAHNSRIAPASHDLSVLCLQKVAHALFSLSFVPSPQAFARASPEASVRRQVALLSNHHWTETDLPATAAVLLPPYCGCQRERTAAFLEKFSFLRTVANAL